VKYDKFVNRVGERAGVTQEQAESLTRATLQVLADRISGGQDADLAARLPEELARLVRKAPQKLPEKYGFDEFVEKVRERAVDVPAEAVLPGIRAVLLTLRDATGGKEFRDTMAQLSHEFGDLLQDESAAEAGEPRTAASGGDRTAASGGDRTAGAAAPRGQRAAGPGPLAAQDDELVQRTAERAGVSPQEAVQLTQATLSTLGDLIGGQAHEIALRLPDISGEWLDEPPETPAQNYGVESFVSRVRDLTIDVMDDDITPGIQAVMITLREAVGEAELAIALRPLPGEYDELLVRIA
jgi:uncharacterized protein (DUF2267 family)